MIHLISAEKVVLFSGEEDTFYDSEFLIEIGNYKYWFVYKETNDTDAITLLNNLSNKDKKRIILQSEFKEYDREDDEIYGKFDLDVYIFVLHENFDCCSYRK